MTAHQSFENFIKQYQKSYDIAIELYALFEDATASELLRIGKTLSNEVEALLRFSNLNWSSCGNLSRHLTFLNRYLEKGDKISCSQDIKDILFTDLPALLRVLISKSEENNHLDLKLRDGVIPLINGGHHDSAIRKVFILLTERLRRIFNINSPIDGDDLINKIFGSNSKLCGNLNEDQKQAMRNLLSGFYGVFRNNFAHNDVEPDIGQSRAMLEMGNSIILKLEQIANN
ncbi:MAG: hypothetical protein B7X83_03815 [Polynucleobacter sp. 17-46-58]|jgi:hypothetical protein|nr:MAG: hypothetical protein B7Y55_02070 [Polynucleobacter sp. 35-46-207]OYZ37219.1 MAG: hypothetical protein B7Y22_03800 [Polynucleobacter sp. 16-46-70]OZA40874.1 MAG: hypothetical protein B7X83_03815 [Polynucleobacter sp. 17-46-58]OZB48662.1 MAG: hypothetical protein B7X60_03440 [Polynucleobacter sp. 39-45-136]HQS60642.1 TIGR02391 family protein [Polynucleobacter sp.]